MGWLGFGTKQKNEKDPLERLKQNFLKFSQIYYQEYNTLENILLLKKQEKSAKSEVSQYNIRITSFLQLIELFSTYLEKEQKNNNTPIKKILNNLDITTEILPCQFSQKELEKIIIHRKHNIQLIEEMKQLIS